MSFHDKTVEEFEIQFLMSCNRHLTWEDCTVGGVLERARKEGRLKKRGNGEYISTSAREAWEWFARGVKSRTVQLPRSVDYAARACSIKEMVAFDYAVNLVTDRLIEADISYKIGDDS